MGSEQYSERLSPQHDVELQPWESKERALDLRKPGVATHPHVRNTVTFSLNLQQPHKRRHKIATRYTGVRARHSFRYEISERGKYLGS
jgi:hypothetical protein